MQRIFSCTAMTMGLRLMNFKLNKIVKAPSEENYSEGACFFPADGHEYHQQPYLMP